MAIAAADVLQSRSDRWWLMVEAGDVDWANHANNLDSSIGALHSGDDAFVAIANGSRATAVARHSPVPDCRHGHYLVIDNPEAIARLPAVARMLPAAALASNASEYFSDFTANLMDCCVS